MTIHRTGKTTQQKKKKKRKKFENPREIFLELKGDAFYKHQVTQCVEESTFF